jgi:hypothetical protein
MAGRRDDTDPGHDLGFTLSICSGSIPASFMLRANLPALGTDLPAPMSTSTWHSPVFTYRKV